MDDILCVYAKAPYWDHEKFMADFKKSGGCYFEPLKLEPGKDGTFLETQYELRDGKFSYRLKNENLISDRSPKVWRYQHYKSHSTAAQKRAVLIATLRKVHSMASGPEVIFQSARQKLAEFERLQYPPAMLRGACGYIGKITGEGRWIAVRESLHW